MNAEKQHASHESATAKWHPSRYRSLCRGRGYKTCLFLFASVVVWWYIAPYYKNVSGEMPHSTVQNIVAALLALSSIPSVVSYNVFDLSNAQWTVESSSLNISIPGKLPSVVR